MVRAGHTFVINHGDEVEIGTTRSARNLLDGREGRTFTLATHEAAVLRAM